MTTLTVDEQERRDFLYKFLGTKTPKCEACGLTNWRVLSPVESSGGRLALCRNHMATLGAGGSWVAVYHDPLDS